MKRIMVFLIFLFVAIQFYQPSLNVNTGQVYKADFIQVYNMPAKEAALLKKSCYDCHSNNSNYAWFNYLQPVRTLVEHHIKNAKADLNFNEWGSYSPRKQERLLTSIKEQIETKKMPLPSYTLLHKNARLSDEQIVLLTDWLKEQK